MPRPTVSTTFNAVDKLTRPVNRMQKRIGGFAKFVGAAFVTGAAARGFKAIINQAQKIENVTASFIPMMGSVEKADELVGALNKTAATTPFQLENIATSAQQLLPAMNGDIEKVVKTFRMLGDTAGGSTEKLNRISAVYSRVLLKNKLETGDLNILTERGIPIYEELSKVMGISVAEMSKMASQGKITGDDLTKAFQKMTSEGGVFYKGMEIASQTLTGKISTLKDNISLTAAEIGKQLLPTIKPLIDRAIELAGRMREWVSENSGLINQRIQSTIEKITAAARFLSQQWKNGIIPAILGAVVAFKAVTTAIVGAQGIIAAIKAVKIAMAAGSLISMFNPITLIAGAIAAAAFLIIKNWKPISAFFKGLWEGIVKSFTDAWNRIKAIWEKITGAAKAVKEFLGGIGSKSTAESRAYYGNRGQRADNPYAGLVSANQGMIESRSYSESRSKVDINVGGLPQGSTVRQRGRAPGVTLNYGYQGGM